MVAFLGMLIEPDDVSVLIKDRREFPALHFKYDPEQTDPQPAAFFREFAVIHPSVESHSGTDLSEGFLFKVGQADAAAALGFSPRLLSEMENGRDTVAYGKVLRYAGYLAMDLVLRERG